MKVLDVASLNEGIHTTLQEIEKIQSQLSGVQRSVRDIIALDQYLKGKTGEAIRSFYKQIHEPFLIYMHQSLTDYAEQLQVIEQAIQAYEPDKNGLIRQGFLDNNIRQSLDRTEDIAGDLVDQANREIASIGDLVSLPRLDMGELSFVVQKGRKKTREIVDQLHELDHTQTKNLAKVEEKLDVMKQYTSEMTRKFNQSGQITHSFDFGSIYHLPTLPILLKSIYGEPVVEEEKEDNFFMKGLKATGNFIKKTAVTTYDVGIGGGIGLVDVGKDTVVGLYDTVTDPKGTVESLYHSVTNPVETYKYIEKSIADSYERDMINGDAESRSHWVTYALGTTATAVVGTKGAGALTKTGVATTKTAVQKSVTTVTNMMNAMQSSRLAQLLPYWPHTQVAMPGGVPSSVINGPVLKENLFMQAEKLPGSGGGVNGSVKGSNVLGSEKLAMQDFIKEVLKTKPMNSPIPEKWYQKGGDISIDKKRTWTYTNKAGDSVSYPNGYPDFSVYVHPIIKPVIIKVASPKNPQADFKAANEAAGLNKSSIPPVPKLNQPPKGYTWHHHEDGKTMILVRKDIHRDFRHIGGQSVVNGKK